MISSSDVLKTSYLASIGVAIVILAIPASAQRKQSSTAPVLVQVAESNDPQSTVADVGDSSILWGAPSLEENQVITATAGESVDGFPNWNERVLHEWINRSRSDPQADLTGCTQCPDKSCYSPVAPLAWNSDLSRAARFHSAHMAKAGFFAHNSPCTLNPAIGTLYPNSCDGSPGCACVGPGTTTTQVRVQTFAPTLFYGGEIIASVGDPNQAFYLWLNEATGSGTCSFSFENGHRWLILKANGAVGAGVFSAAVADFGSAPTPSKIVSGAHYPRQAASVEVWANWYDSAAPASAAVVVNGISIPMTRRRGTGTNGAWSATLSGVGGGTSRYYFQFRDSAGTTHSYPTTGSYGICNTCPDWSSQRATGQSLRGDANGDGAVNSSDIFFLINFLFASGPAPIGSGDANSDGRVTSSDTFFLINFLFAAGPAPGP